MTRFDAWNGTASLATAQADSASVETPFAGVTAQSAFHSVSQSPTDTATVNAPSYLTDLYYDTNTTGSLSLTLLNVSHWTGKVSMSFSAAGSTATDGVDVIVPSFESSYDISQSPGGSYTLDLPSITVLQDFLYEGVETVAITIHADGQVFDSGTDTTTVFIPIVDMFPQSPLGIIRAATPGNDTLSGTAANDIIAGEGGADVINGGDGDDSLYSDQISPYWQSPPNTILPVLDHGTEVDTINGGAGFDHIYAGYGDIIDGGADGAELLISLAGANSGVTADFSALDNGGTLTIGGGTISNITTIAWIEGTNFADTIIGDNTRWYAPGTADNTAIFGLDGNDHIVAGQATGSIYGGNGNDTIESAYANSGIYGYYGEAGDDVISVNNATNGSLADGGSGNDTLTLAGSAYGGDGDDTITAATNTTYGLGAYGDGGNDRLTGGALNDQLSGGDGSDIVDGGSGDDLLMSGGTSQDLYPGADQRERADFGSEHDVVSGGGGNDTIYAGYGDDVDGGSGTNWLWLSAAGASAGVTINAATFESGAPAQFGGGTITNIQQVVGLFGSSFDDDLTLSRSGTVEGLGGNDTITGSSEHDEIYGGGGADVIHAGGGDDTIWVGPDEAPDGEQIDGGAGIDSVYVSDASITGATLTGVENLFGLGTAEVGQTQLSSVTTIGGQFYFATPGAITLQSLNTSGVTFILNDGGNQVDLTKLIFESYLSITIQGSDVADVVTAPVGNANFWGNGGNDVFISSGGLYNFFGGDGNDTLVAGSGYDSFNGSDGQDTLIGTITNLNGDSFDFGVGDRIVITDATLANFTFSVSGSTLSFNGGSLTGAYLPTGTHIAASAAAEGGVQLTLIHHDPANDFNGDGRSDVLWRNASTGQISDWLAAAGSGFTDNYNNARANVSPGWTVAGTGDFNGDGRDDILWRNSSTGQITDWLGKLNGGFTDNYNASKAGIPLSWQVAGIGDFNGDGHDDVLWRSDTGVVTDWLGSDSGAFTSNYARSAVNVSADWHIVGTGDFNGDGRTDILWRSGTVTVDWLANPNGGFASNWNASVVSIPTDWTVAGTRRLQRRRQGRHPVAQRRRADRRLARQRQWQRRLQLQLRPFRGPGGDHLEHRQHR